MSSPRISRIFLYSFGIKVAESILLESDEKLKLKYEVIKEDVIDKLMDLKSQETDNEIKSKITETIKKVEAEKYDKLNYFKLQELNRNL